MKRKIKAILYATLLLAVGMLSACGGDANSKSEYMWTNERAVYAYVKAGHEQNILEDVEGAFATLPFQKVYVAEKNEDRQTPLTLLFTVADDGAENKQELVRWLRQDERIAYVRECYDIPFETVDTRYIEKEKDVIAVGERMPITVKGRYDGYVQPFDFGGLYVKPTADKNYTVKDFGDIALKSVQREDNGWLYLELTEKNYFDVMKAADVLSRLSTVTAVVHDTRNVVSIIPSVWQVSDETVIRLETDTENYGTAVVVGLKAGEVTIELATARCKITVE